MLLLSSRSGDGHLEFLVFYRGDHIPILIVAEDLGTRPPQPVEGLWGGMPVGVVHTALYDGYFRREAAEEERGR